MSWSWWMPKWRHPPEFQPDRQRALPPDLRQSQQPQSGPARHAGAGGRPGNQPGCRRERRLHVRGRHLNFYKNNFNRDSLDGKGMQLISTTRYCPDSGFCPYENAFWNGRPDGLWRGLCIGGRRGGARDDPRRDQQYLQPVLLHAAGGDQRRPFRTSWANSSI